MADTIEQLRAQWAAVFVDDAPAGAIVPSVDLEARNDLLDTMIEMFEAVRRPYKVYSANVSQNGAGTNAPTAVIMENNFAEDFVLSRVGVGDYNATLAGAFISGKTFLLPGNRAVYAAADSLVTILTQRLNVNTIGITVFLNGVPTDGFSNLPFEVKVYD